MPEVCKQLRVCPRRWHSIKIYQKFIDLLSFVRRRRWALCSRIFLLMENATQEKCHNRLLKASSHTIKLIVMSSKNVACSRCSKHNQKWNKSSASRATRGSARHVIEKFHWKFSFEKLKEEIEKLMSRNHLWKINGRQHQPHKTENYMRRGNNGSQKCSRLRGTLSEVEHGLWPRLSTLWCWIEVLANTTRREIILQGIVWLKRILICDSWNEF